jgi:hypothetical protein
MYGRSVESLYLLLFKHVNARAFTKMTRVLVLRIDGTFEVRETTSSKDYNKILDGWFEMVSLDEHVICYVNEEARLKHLPCNAWSLKLMKLRLVPCVLYGNIIVCSFDPSEGDDLDLAQDVVQLITQ